MGAHARRIGLGHLADDSSRICRDKDEEETVLHLAEYMAGSLLEEK